MSDPVGRALVSGQGLCAGYLLFTTSWLHPSWPALVLLIAAVLLAGWSFSVMRPGTFNIRPVIREGAQLITQGPYRYVRNPMYGSVLLAGAALLLMNYSPCRLVAYGLLAVILLVKIRIEEEKLALCFAEYGLYRQQTGCFLPKSLTLPFYCIL